MDDDESRVAEKYEALRGVMDEQMRRLWAATEARVGVWWGQRCRASGRPDASNDRCGNEGATLHYARSCKSNLLTIPKNAKEREGRKGIQVENTSSVGSRGSARRHDER